jgi:hypothetical protein
MFGDICPALQVTSRNVTAAIKRGLPNPVSMADGEIA